MIGNKQFEIYSRPVIFGEVLFDHFPDGSKHLGGAPFNVAWHLQGLGMRPLLVSRIGQDTEGEIVLTEMVRWGLDTQAVQIDPVLATGNVQVSIVNDEPIFNISENQAWDNISSALVIELIRNLPCSMLYFGSLSLRSAVSGNTLNRILQEVNLPAYVDINLRKPWFNESVIQQCLQEASWLKLNEAEFLAVSEGVSEADVRVRHQLDSIYMTRGSKGATLVTEKLTLKVEAAGLQSQGNSVGAGDAFAAICIYGMHHGWEQEQILRRANEFAARICEGTGALPLAKEDYQASIKAWQ